MVLGISTAMAKLKDLIKHTVNQAIRNNLDGVSDRAWLSPNQASEYLDCTIQHLQMLRARRRGPPFVRFGRKILYSREELDTYLKKLTVQTEFA